MAPPFKFILRLSLLLLSSSFGFAQQTPAPGVVQVPLTASSDGQRYVANVNMSTSPMTQRFGFAISTTTGYILVADTSCTTCTGDMIPTYNATQSISAQTMDNEKQQQAVPVAGGVMNAGTGFLSKEDCALREANGGIWQYNNQTIVQANSSAVFQAGISGLLGLGTNTATFNDTIFAGWLASNSDQANFTFGLALSPLPGAQNEAPATNSDGGANDGTANAGMLHLQQPDPSSYSGDIQWQDVQNVAPATGSSSNSSGSVVGDVGGSSWVVQIDGWNFTSGTAQTSNSQSASAAVEPFFANIFLPQAQATQLYAAVPGSQPTNASSDGVGQAYSVPCDANMTFTVVLGGQGYAVPTDALVLKGPTNGSCVGAIEGWLDASATNYLLGSRFISTVYMAFSVGQPPVAQQKVGIALRATNTTSSKKRVGAIVGGVIGGVAFLLLVCGGIFWWLRRRQRREAPGPRSNAEMAQRSGLMTEKISDSSYALDSNGWTPPPVSPTLASPSPYHRSIATPLSVDVPSILSSTAATISPQETVGSDAFASPIKVKQWVTGLRPSSVARSVVPTDYDYGNNWEPGQPSTLSPTEELERDLFAAMPR